MCSLSETSGMSDCTQNDRFKEQSPFTNVGLDLFGSYEVTDGQTTRRNSESKTVLGVVLICLVTRAIHITYQSSPMVRYFLLC